MKLEELRVKIFADGADKRRAPRAQPQSARSRHDDQPDADAKGGYLGLRVVRQGGPGVDPDKPISFEVFADDFPEMRRQALKIRTWQSNVHVKIPITNTRGTRPCRS